MSNAEKLMTLKRSLLTTRRKLIGLKLKELEREKEKLARLEALHKSRLPSKYVPHTPTERQASFLALDCREAFYGGAAGGGKSDALLMAALQWVHIPGYSAILFRRTYQDLALAGALMDRAGDWLGGTDARRCDGGRTWVFPSGARLAFGYLANQGDHFRYKSAEFQFVGFDELTQFEESQYRFLFSRLRRLAGSPVPIRMRAASNPGDRGHEWVKARFLAPAGGGARVFVPAKLDDNPHLDRAEYVAALAELDPITRAQMLAGDWDAHAGGRFRPEWFGPAQRFDRHGTGYLLAGRHGPIIEYHKVRRFLTCDPAASAENVAKKTDPDWTVIGVWGLTPDHQLLWLDCYRFRKELPDIVPALVDVWDRYDPEACWIESVASNSGVYQLAARTRVAARPISPSAGAMGKSKDKLVVATKAINLAAAGRIFLPLNGWPHPESCRLEDAVGELVRFTGDPKRDAHDDVVSALSYAAIVATRKEDEGASFKPQVIGGGR